MHDFITVAGTIGSDPDAKVSQSSNVSWTSFRMVTNERRRNPDGSWENISSNWYTVTAFRNLAKNVAASMKKGDRVIVAGRLELNESSNSGERRVWPQIVATAVGPDLNFGIATPERRSKHEEQPAPELETDQMAQGYGYSTVDPATGELRSGEQNASVASVPKWADPAYDSVPEADDAFDSEAADTERELVGAGAASDSDIDTPF